MFNFFLKSAFYYTVINKYGKKLLFILSNLILIVFIQFIYTDIIEILTINDLKDYTLYALLGKWLIILFSLSLVIVTLVKIIKNKKPLAAKGHPKVEIETKTTFEDEILNKGTLKSKSDLMMEELLSKK